MKGGSKLFIVAGVGLALVAVLLLVMNPNSGDKADANKQAADAKVTIVEATTNIPAHSILRLEDLVEKEVDAGSAPADAVTSITQVVGQAYRIPLTAGQPLLLSQVETPGLRNDIAVGMRAMALPINEVSALSGLIQDGDYIDIIFHARINLVRHLPTTAAIIPEDGNYVIKGPMIIPPDLEMPNHPIAGDPGSHFFIRDDIGEAQHLEPVAKIMLQDIRILRVVRPGEEYLPNGSKADQSVTEGTASTGQEELGQLILEVTPEQAELVTFIQDKRHEYQVIVRGKDDHAKVSTSGVTFQILATDPDWMLPWPQTVVSPEVAGEEEPFEVEETAGTPIAAEGEGEGDDEEDPGT